MAEAAKALIAPPTPAEVDKLAISYDGLKAKVFEAVLAQREAAEKMELVKQECVELIRKFGSVHEKKSKLLHGIKWEIMGTFGAGSPSIDTAAVETLRLFLKENNKTRLLKRLFESATRWTLRSDARAEILKPDIGDDVRALFAVCEVKGKDKSPSIEARLKQPA